MGCRCVANDPCAGRAGRGRVGGMVYLDDVRECDDILLWPDTYQVRGVGVQVGFRSFTGGLRLVKDGQRLRELEEKLESELQGLDMLKAARRICKRVGRMRAYG